MSGDRARRSRVSSYQLARWAPLPGAVQLDLVETCGHELLLNPHLAPEAAGALVDAVLDGRLHPLAAAEVDASVLAGRVDALAGRAAVPPSALEWLASHRMFDTDGAHWDQVVEALGASCEQPGGLRMPYLTRPGGVGARLVSRAPVRVRRRLAAHGSLMDRVRVLCLEYAGGTGGGADADRDDAEYLASGDLVVEPLPATDNLLMLAALCRARPRLGLHLGERFVDLPEAAVRWSPHTVTLFAWTVPWRRASGWRRTTSQSAVLAERLAALSGPAASRANAALDDHLVLLGTARPVPEGLRDRAWAALSGRRAARSTQLDCHELLFGGEGHRVAAAALSGEHGRRSQRVAGALAGALAGPVAPGRARGVAGPDLSALTAVCGCSCSRWRLALALADGGLDERELADCIEVSG